MKAIPPVMPNKKPNTSITEGSCQILIESKTINNMLLISTNAATGPAGPFANAIYMNDLPIVSKMLPTMPTRKRYRSKGCTDLQYQLTPRSSTTKLVTLDVP